MRRMVWVKRGGRLYGEWTWALYERDEEWVYGGNLRWRDMGNVQQSTVVLNLGSSIPQEVLRYMLKDFNWVRSDNSHGCLTCKSLTSPFRDARCSLLRVGRAAHGSRSAPRSCISALASAL